MSKLFMSPSLMRKSVAGAGATLASPLQKRKAATRARDDERGLILPSPTDSEANSITNGNCYDNAASVEAEVGEEASEAVDGGGPASLPVGIGDGTEVAPQTPDVGFSLPKFKSSKVRFFNRGIMTGPFSRNALFSPAFPSFCFA